MKYNSKGNRNKSDLDRQINEMLSKPINEISLAVINRAIKKLNDLNRPYQASKLEKRRDEIIQSYHENGEATRLVYLSKTDIVVEQKAKSGKSKTFEKVYVFEVWKYLPQGNYILISRINTTRIAAVELSPDGNGAMLDITDQKMKNDIRKALEVENINKASRMWFINRIQPDSRDEDGNPVAPNNKLASWLSREIFYMTSECEKDENGIVKLKPNKEPVKILRPGIRIPRGVFAQICGKPRSEKKRVENYTYLGGINLTNDLKVRVCKFIGQKQDDYRIYPVYVKYFGYGMVLVIHYRMRAITISGGAGYGTVYTSLLEKNYIEISDPDVSGIKKKSSIVNICALMTMLHEKTYTMPDGEELNACDIILDNISRIIKEYDIDANWGDYTTTAKKLSLEMMEETRDRVLAEIDLARKQGQDVGTGLQYSQYEKIIQDRIEGTTDSDNDDEDYGDE